MTPETRRERFELLYDGLYTPISGYVLRRTRDPEDAADTLRCATVTESVAGTTSVVVRGPS